MRKEIQIIIDANSARAVKGINKTKKAVGGMSAKFKSAFGKMGISAKKAGLVVAAAFTAIVAGIGAAMVRAQDFTKRMGQVSTLTNMSLKSTSKEVRKLSAEFGLAKDELTKGLYDALSAGVPKENVFSFMKVAAKAAQAGAAEVQVAVEATTRIMDAYGKEAGTATDINDMLFKTVKKGVITYEQLASQIGKVAGIAQKAGIPLNDLLATIATSSKTVNAEQLFTGIRSSIMALGKTASGSQLMIEKGLGGALASVSDATGGTLFGLRSVINEAQALPVALSVSGKNAVKFKDNLDEVTNSTDSMQEAFDKMKDLNPLDKFKQGLDNVVLTIGSGLIQALAPALDSATAASAAFAESTELWFTEKKYKDLYKYTSLLGYGVFRLTKITEGWKKIMDAPNVGDKPPEETEAPKKEVVDEKKAARDKEVKAEKKANKTKQGLLADMIKSFVGAGKKRLKAFTDNLNLQLEYSKTWNKKRTDAIKAENDKIADLEQELADKKKGIELDALNATKDALDKKMAARKEMAGKTVQQIIDDAKAAKEKGKIAEEEEKKAEKIRGKQKRGIVNKRENAWLKAFEKRGALDDGGLLQGQIDATKRQIKSASEKSLASIDTELKLHNQKLDKHLRGG